MNVMEHNDIHPLPISINTKFLNSLQLEWSKYVTLTRQNANIKETEFDQLFDSLSQYEQHVIASRTNKVARNHDLLALVAHSNVQSSHSHESPSYSHSSHPYYVTHPSSVIGYKDDYQGELQGDDQEDKLTTAMMLLVRAITQHYSTPTNSHLHTSLNTRNQVVIQDGNRMVQQIEANDQTNQRVPQTESNLGKSNIQCYNCNAKDEAGSNLNDEENDFMLTIHYEDDSLEDLNAAVNASHIHIKSRMHSESVHEQTNHAKLKIVINTSDDDQIDSSILFNDPYVVVTRIANQHGNVNVVAARAEGNSNEINGNQIRCYNCRGEGHYASNCIVKPRKRDAAYLQTQLQIAQKDEAGIQLNFKEFDFMAAAGAYDEIEKVTANCNLQDNLQQASTSGTQSDKAPVYDSDGSAEVHHSENCYDNDIFNMFTQEEQYTKLLEPIPEPHQVQQNDSNVISAVSSVEQSGGTVEQHPVNVEETRVLYDSLYNNLAIEVEKVNSVNRKLRETNADLTSELARYKNQEKCFEINQEKYDKLERCYQKSVYQEQCLTKKINALHLSSAKQITTLNEEIANLNNQLSKEKSTVSFLQEERKKLKNDFKTREDELLDKQIQLENKIKELDNILVKMGQSIQTMHMLSSKPDSFYHEQKMDLGYQNPFYLKQAQQKQQSLYNG
ncbi:retrovirus-related pol polyprotein from transposon TNT 1-94, partial [Tanacetum coccineum]